MFNDTPTLASRQKIEWGGFDRLRSVCIVSYSTSHRKSKNKRYCANSSTEEDSLDPTGEESGKLVHYSSNHGLRY